MSYCQDFVNIIQFAIDRLDNSSDLNNYFKQIKLDEDVFFDKLYVHRQIPEQELKDSILKYLKPIIIYGFPGVGKTSLVRSVLHDMRNENKKNIIEFNFDFGNKQVITDEVYNNGTFEIYSWLNQELMRKLKEYLTNHGISDGDIVKYLIQNINNKYSFNIEFQNLLSDIYSLYKDDDETNLIFKKWFLDKIKNKVSSIMEYYKKLQHSIKIIDYLYYLATYQANNIIVIFYDNTDSIHLEEVRRKFYEYISLQCGIYGNYSKIIISSRIYNIFSNIFTDQGAHNYQRLRIDYREFLDSSIFEQEKLKLIKQKGNYSEVDLLQIKIKNEQINMKVYAEEILQHRIDFINNEYSDKNFDEKLIIDDLYKSILNNKHIYVALFSMANYNRREMFKLLGYFIKYLFFDLEIKSIEQLGNNTNEISFNIESLFYHWIIVYEDTHVNIYDYISELDELVSNKENIQINKPGCSLTHLILVLIYKLTKSERYSFSYKYKTKIKDVISKLREIGYLDELLVKNKLLDIIKYNNEYLGFIETSEFLKLTDINSLHDNVEIWLSPRACYMIEFLGLKFLFILALCKISELNAEDNFKTNIDFKNIISFDNLNYVIGKLVKMSIVHLSSLINIKKELESHKHKNWLNYYKKWFCINTVNNNSIDGNGDLFVLNVLESHLKFIRRQKNNSQNDLDKQITVYENLKIVYKEIIKDLEDNNFNSDVITKIENIRNILN